MSKDNIHAYLGAGTSYNGTLNFTGTVRIDGEFTGEINSEGTLELGKSSQVKGVVHVRQLILNGALEGDVYVSERVIMRSGAKLRGQLSAKTLVMEEGAFLQGKIMMEREQDAGEDALRKNPEGKGDEAVETAPAQ